MKKLLHPFLGAVLVSLFNLLGCTGPDFRRDIHDPVMSTQQMQAELERLHQVNLTVGREEFDPSDYPVFAGIDVRNGKTLVEKFICWDGCPELGNVYLFYQGVDTEEACLDAAGSPLISPVPIPGAYWGCGPIVDGLSVPARRSG